MLLKAASLAGAIALGLAADQSRAAELASNPSIGWGTWSFNQTLDEALAGAPNLDWNQYSLRKCRDRMEIDGCFLDSGEKAFLPPVDAIRLRPILHFDHHDRLRSISLIYEREGAVSQSQCLNIFGRLIDWQANKYGSFVYDNNPQSAKDRVAGWIRVHGHSPGGTAIEFGKSEKAAAYVAVPVHNERYPGLTVFSAFVTVSGKPNCHAVVTFDRAET